MKFTKFFLGAMLAVALVSCSGKGSLIRDYEKACNDGDAIKAAQIVSKLEAYDESEFTDEELERINVATLVLEGKAVESMGNMLNTAGDMMKMFEN
ncbi:MAG: hypothetical protein SO182_01885 [Paludibacteraceae bacterium]|nr:hypothetical protein [Bacteroidales bacterium]MDD6782216.1 hypothetical protein [Bacteroidales bacterium]MDY4849976.1 hypothetical protein [Paludibacteraceae bacterium]